MNTSKARGKSSGWTAFTLKQQTHGHESEVDRDPYPPISSSHSSLYNSQNIRRNPNLQVRPFSSVIPCSVKSQTSARKKDSKNPMLSANSTSQEQSGSLVIQETSHDMTIEKLNRLHSWADSSLIEDIMLAVDNDIEKASAILNGMDSSSGEDKEAKIAEMSSDDGCMKCDKMYYEKFSLKRLDFAAEDDPADKYKALTDINTSYGEKPSELASINTTFGVNFSNTAGNMESMMELLCSVPVEPEWEEDDLYLNLRKEAIKMMRSASQHAKTAKNAFLRGDHLSAGQHSLKAQEEWLTAERLNSTAAEEILTIRNSENDMWKLDLHGLHVAEAVQALQHRLQTIELQGSKNRLTAKEKKGMHTSCMDIENDDKQFASLRQIQTPLQVITGVGKHSKGQASLPTAVKSFLSEKEYRFEEARPGVISVWPKFRYK